MHNNNIDHLNNIDIYIPSQENISQYLKEYRLRNPSQNPLHFFEMIRNKANNNTSSISLYYIMNTIKGIVFTVLENSLDIPETNRPILRNKIGLRDKIVLYRFWVAQSTILVSHYFPEIEGIISIMLNLQHRDKNNKENVQLLFKYLYHFIKASIETRALEDIILTETQLTPEKIKGYGETLISTIASLARRFTSLVIIPFDYDREPYKQDIQQPNLQIKIVCTQRKYLLHEGSLLNCKYPAVFCFIFRNIIQKKSFIESRTMQYIKHIATTYIITQYTMTKTKNLDKLLDRCLTDESPYFSPTEFELLANHIEQLNIHINTLNTNNITMPTASDRRQSNTSFENYNISQSCIDATTKLINRCKGIRFQSLNIDGISKIKNVRYNNLLIDKNTTQKLCNSNNYTNWQEAIYLIQKSRAPETATQVLKCKKQYEIKSNGTPDPKTTKSTSITEQQNEPSSNQSTYIPIQRTTKRSHNGINNQEDVYNYNDEDIIPEQQNKIARLDKAQSNRGQISESISPNNTVASVNNNAQQMSAEAKLVYLLFTKLENLVNIDPDITEYIHQNIHDFLRLKEKTNNSLLTFERLSSIMNHYTNVLTDGDSELKQSPEILQAYHDYLDTHINTIANNSSVAKSTKSVIYTQEEPYQTDNHQPNTHLVESEALKVEKQIVTSYV